MCMYDTHTCIYVCIALDCFQHIYQSVFDHRLPLSQAENLSQVEKVQLFRMPCCFLFMVITTQAAVAWVPSVKDLP